MGTRLSALKCRIPGWVHGAMKNLSTQADIFVRGWRHLRVEESLRSALLQDAKDFHAKGSLMGDPKAACIGERVPEKAAPEVIPETPSWRRTAEAAELGLPTPRRVADVWSSSAEPASGDACPAKRQQQ